MKHFLKPIQAAFLLVIVIALAGCNLGQAAEPTPTAVDVNAVKTSAAATAFVQLTLIAAQASPTPEPTQPPAVTDTPQAVPTTDGSAPTAEVAVPTETQQLVIQVTDTPVIAIELTATLPGLPAATATTAPVVGAATNTGPLCKNSTFVADVTIPDGTVLKPGEKFTKIWSVQNSGICAWDEGFGIVLWNGPTLDAQNDYFSAGEVVNPGGVVDMALHMKAPWTPGEYISHWVMVDDTGKPFGTDLVVYIIVK